jgi:hypothetical protein
MQSKEVTKKKRQEYRLKNLESIKEKDRLYRQRPEVKERVEEKS